MQGVGRPPLHPQAGLLGQQECHSSLYLSDRSSRFPGETPQPFQLSHHDPLRPTRSKTMTTMNLFFKSLSLYQSTFAAHSDHTLGGEWLRVHSWS